MEKIAAPRGTADLYPPQSERWQALEARIHALARRFGYGEIRTPMFEATELFVRGVGETTDIVEKEMYTFTDKGGRSMTLRPEWTAPVVRALLEHHLMNDGPQRLYYVGPFFRYERPQAGRFRQANQFGAECYGYEQPEADLEVIQLAGDLIASYGLPGVELRINTIGDARCRPAYREALLAYFRPLSETLSGDSQRRLERNPLRILDSKALEDQAAIAAAPTFLDTLCDECAAHFARLRALLDATGIAYRADPRLVRGFDYYTRTVFEFSSNALGAQSAICGGGRYDELVKSLGGPATPAVGFGLGIERFTMLLDQLVSAEAPARSGIALIALGEPARALLVPVLAELRRTASVGVTMDYAASKIGAHFKRADRYAARLAVIAGDDELALRRVNLRDLALRSEQSIDLGAEADARGLARAVIERYEALPRETGRDDDGDSPVARAV